MAPGGIVRAMPLVVLRVVDFASSQPQPSYRCDHTVCICLEILA
jgi:hypothetical protein